VKFWDSSAIVPLLVAQRQSERAAQLFQSDPELIVWWGARVECVSAIARLERDGALGAAALSTSIARLQEFAKIWDEVQPTERLRSIAERLLRVHQLRAADAFQLAAMVAVGGEEPRDLDVVCFDDRLAAAALREGFRLTCADTD
jgi:predicted nucleic acid-binding protein